MPYNIVDWIIAIWSVAGGAPNLPTKLLSRPRPVDALELDGVLPVLRPSFFFSVSVSGRRGSPLSSTFRTRPRCPWPTVRSISHIVLTFVPAVQHPLPLPARSHHPRTRALNSRHSALDKLVNLCNVDGEENRRYRGPLGEPCCYLHLVPFLPVHTTIFTPLSVMSTRLGFRPIPWSSFCAPGIPMSRLGTPLLHP